MDNAVIAKSLVIARDVVGTATDLLEGAMREVERDAMISRNGPNPLVVGAIGLAAVGATAVGVTVAGVAAVGVTVVCGTHAAAKGVIRLTEEVASAARSGRDRADAVFEPAEDEGDYQRSRADAVFEPAEDEGDYQRSRADAVSEASPDEADDVVFDESDSDSEDEAVYQDRQRA